VECQRRSEPCGKENRPWGEITTNRYLNDPTFEDRPLRCISPELNEFDYDAEDLAAELAYTRYYLAKEEAKTAELVAVLNETVEWLEDDRFDDDYIMEDWYQAAKIVLADTASTPLPEPPQEEA